MKLLGWVTALAAGCASTAPVAEPARVEPPPVTIHVPGGEVVGTAHDGVRAFLGIPYAAPPVGALRWRPPAPVVGWSAPRDATQFGPACPQPDQGVTRVSSEDCLSLNVWTPAARGELLPVLVWIHGGAFIGGSSSDDIYDGVRLATTAHAIVVTINYRLGALGWMSNRAFRREYGAQTAPSVALLDQRAALAWVHDTIAAFGGDPAHVMLFGESAGGWSTCAQLAMPGSRGLFTAAIIQSGACSDVLYATARDAEAQGDALAAAVGCTGDDPDVRACLQRVSVDKLLSALPMKRHNIATPGVWWSPVVDGHELPKLPLAAMQAGESAPVPLIIGWAHDEGTLHTVGFGDDELGRADELAFVRDSFGADAAEAIPALYASESPTAALTDIITDGVFACGARRAARALTSRGVPVYEYEWTRALDNPVAHRLGATHSVDLFFEWGNPSLGIGLSPAEQPLARTVMEAFGRFARTGDPGWPRYEPSRDELQVLDVVPSVASHVKQDICDAWDAVEPGQPMR